MVNAHLDTLELELRKLEGVRTVGFSTQHDVLFIQLFIEAEAPASTLPFEATRIAQRHSSSSVAVELVRWSDASTQIKSNSAGLGSIFENTQAAQSVRVQEVQQVPVHAGSIGSFSYPNSEATLKTAEQTAPFDETFEVETDEQLETNDEQPDTVELVDENIEPISAFGTQFADDKNDLIKLEFNEEVDLTSDEIIPQEEPFDFVLDSDEDFEERRDDDNDIERIALILVTTSSENDEIEIHLSFDELRTIGRAPTNRGLLGAIDATVFAISELTGSDEFHAEWARSLEPGPEHASLVAVGLTNAQGTDTRHGIAGGSSPIEAAARATLNALNRTAVLANQES